MHLPDRIPHEFLFAPSVARADRGRRTEDGAGIYSNTDGKGGKSSTFTRCCGVSNVKFRETERGKKGRLTK
jgi:hypothetical protein